MSNPPSTTSTTLMIDQLRLSPLNVRMNTEDAGATRELEASIRAEGVIQSLSVHPMRGNLKVWGVFAGGRRYRSIRALVDRGDLPRDFAVPVQIHEAPDAEIVARSLAENMLRRDLRLYEMYAAVRRERDLGHKPAEIAARHGQRPIWVERALRIAELSPAIFTAYAAARISTDQAAAFGATADHELQLACFTALMDGPEQARTPAAIRIWLRVDDSEADKLLRFVGEDAYRAADGAIERDLFDDGLDGRSRVTDDKLLRRMADEKVQALRVATRERVARPDLRFVPVPPQAQYGGPEWTLQIVLEEGAQLPAGDVVCSIVIDKDGEPDISFWWASRKAMEGDSKPARPATLRSPARAARVGAGAAIGQQYDNARQTADALIKEEAGLTAEGTQVLRSIRRAILRAALVQDARGGGALGRDLLVFAQCRMLMPIDAVYGPREADLGMKRISGVDGDSDAARAQIDVSEAGRTWQKAIRELKAMTFLSEPDHGAALIAFRQAPAAARDLAAAVVAGIALERSLDADGYRVPLHDVVARQARVHHQLGIRHWWTPTAAFLKLLPRAEQLAIAEPFVESATFATWTRLKVDELTPLVLKAVTGAATSVRKSTAIAAAQWVHPLLRFATADRSLADVYAEQAEAAE